jgi:hypothetical protein
MTCVIQGVVGEPEYGTAPCRHDATHRVRVEGLSALEVCAGHAEAMLRFWGRVYEVRVTRR